MSAIEAVSRHTPAKVSDVTTSATSPEVPARTPPSAPATSSQDVLVLQARLAGSQAAAVRRQVESTLQETKAVHGRSVRRQSALVHAAAQRYRWIARRMDNQRNFGQAMVLGGAVAGIVVGVFTLGAGLAVAGALIAVGSGFWAANSSAAAERMRQSADELENTMQPSASAPS